MEIRHLTDIAPSQGNPRNSEGAFIKLKNGNTAFLYSRYAGTDPNDHAYAEIAMICYDGKSFSEPKILVRPEKGTDETNCMSVSAARMNNGDAAVIYLVKHKGISSEVILRRSPDDFETLDEGVRCVSPLYKGYYVVNNDRIVRLKNGTWVIPAAIHPSTMNYHDQPDNVDMRAKAAFFMSDDDGRTWKQTSDILSLTCGANSGSGLQEPGIIELPNGALYSYFRTDLGRHYESVSVDNGRSWFAPQPSCFTGPCSPLHIKQNPYSGIYYAVWNPVPETQFRYLHSKEPKIWTGGRTPLVIASSADGIHFKTPQIIEDDENAGFCYPAIHFTSSDSLLMSYCAGGVGETDCSCLVRTRIIEITNLDL